MAQATRITVEAATHVPVAKVWSAWNTPSDIVQWNTPDPSWHTPTSENDLRAGGKFKNRMEAKDGSFGFDFEGVYDSVVLHEEISYTMADGRQATTIFTQQNGKTHLATTFDPEQKMILNFKNKGGSQS